MTNFEWIIQSMRVERQSDSLNNVVIIVYSTYRGTSNDGFLGVVTNVTTLLPPDPNNFIPIESLTKQEVVNWILATGTVDVPEMEANIEIQIESQRNPPVYTYTPTWS